MASCKLQNYTKWLKEELGIYQHCSSACSKQITSTTLGSSAILSEKKTLILRLDFNCAHEIILLFEFIKLERKNLKCLTVSVNNKSNF